MDGQVDKALTLQHWTNMRRTTPAVAAVTAGDVAVGLAVLAAAVDAVFARGGTVCTRVVHNSTAVAFEPDLRRSKPSAVDGPALRATAGSAAAANVTWAATDMALCCCALGDARELGQAKTSPDRGISIFVHQTTMAPGDLLEKKKIA